MRAWTRWGGLMLIGLTLASCASGQERYLRRSVNQVSQDAVAKQFGPPHHAQELTTGETIWSYQRGKTSDCREYIVTFDRDKVLRAWKQQKC